MGGKRKLSLNEKLFCRYYIFGVEREFAIGNGTRSYAKAYSKDLTKSYDVCSTNAWEVLRKPEIKEYNRKLVEQAGWNDEAVDGRLSEILYTGKHVDSVQAIKEYNKLKARIIEKVEHSGQITENIVLDPEREEVVKKVVEEIKKRKNL